MSFANRIGIDTSTLIGALLKPQSVPRQAVIHALATRTPCVSPATLAELESVLLRDKFDRYLDWDSRLGFYSFIMPPPRTFRSRWLRKITCHRHAGMTATTSF